ncbi:UvrD-helicase domain-containing protein [Lysinibacillus sp. FSL L8-0126]|uniref:UvrD-helicase domain-containing protein n=1 Tax=Lysinibacillus sp. FSL L8-0126 TaxID=2921515 RepID=UPI003159A57B
MSLDTLKEIERKLLPSNAELFDQQREVILNNNSLNIVAGPGSGKTTVLIAKCALLLKKNEAGKKGICLITHTNVAVEEMKIGLERLGYKNIEFPNFIGTIQEFFNTFFVKKALHLLIGNKSFRVLDKNDYQEKFVESFNYVKPHWYTGNPPNFSKSNTEFLFKDDNTFEIISDSINYKYISEFKQAVKQVFQSGILTNAQCLDVSQWYITKYKEKLKTAMANRFDFVLLDEAQDSNEMQYSLLKQLFDNNVNFQRFGDPYQALYNIFNEDEDVWKPTEEISQVNRADISKSSRFGTSIANIVKNLSIEKYDTFESQKLVESFSPYFLVYKNEEGLLTAYRELIGELSNEEALFSQSTKKDAIVAVTHRNLTSTFKSYIRPKSTIKNTGSLIQQSYKFLVDLIAKEFDMSFKETKKIIDENLEFKIKFSKIVTLLLGDELKDISVISTYISTVLRDITQADEQKFKCEYLEQKIQVFKESIKVNKEQKEFKEKDFYIGTIHSTKGETHRSTLLILNYTFEKEGQSHQMMDLLRGYLTGKYVELNQIQDTFIQSSSAKALKLAYVALSRPTHLAAIAIPEEFIQDKAFIDELKEFGWKEYNCKEEASRVDS